MNEPKGLMASDAQQLTKRGPMLEQFMQGSLGPERNQTCRWRRGSLSVSASERSTLMQLAKTCAYQHENT